MKMSRNLLVIALLIAAPLTSMAEEAARKRARRPFVPIDLVKRDRSATNRKSRPMIVDWSGAHLA